MLAVLLVGRLSQVLGWICVNDKLPLCHTELHPDCFSVTYFIFLVPQPQL